MQLVEQYAGVGALRWREGKVGPVPYRIARYQGMMTSGLPVPGLHRIEGVVTLDGVPEAAALVGALAIGAYVTLTRNAPAQAAKARPPSLPARAGGRS